jgi:hypothetical protein
MLNCCIIEFRLSTGWTAFIIGIAVLLTSSALPAQSRVSVNGKMTSLTGQELVVETSSGPSMVKLNDKTVIRGELPIKFSDIAAGMYVGATAAKQPDGTFRASRLHVFSEDQRGTGEGHGPLSSAPGSGLTMTNANVETVEDVAVQNVQGRVLLLKYKGGEIKVLVPADTVVVKRVIGNPTWLKPGAELSITANRADDGAMTATQITVRAAK